MSRYSAAVARRVWPGWTERYLRAGSCRRDRQGLPRTVGLYVGGTALGGLSGRLVTGLVVDLTDSWRLAIATIGFLSLLGAAGFVKLLPPSRHFTPAAETSLSLYVQRLGQHLADPLLRRLFLTGFLLMGSIVTVYNYTGYRLVGPPVRAPKGERTFFMPNPPDAKSIRPTRNVMTGSTVR